MYKDCYFMYFTDIHSNPTWESSQKSGRSHTYKLSLDHCNDHSLLNFVPTK